MALAFVIISVALVILMVTQFLVIQRCRQSLRSEARALSDRAELVDFLNRYTSSIGFSRNTDEWMTQVASFIASSIEAQAVWIYHLEADQSVTLTAFSGKCPVADDDTLRKTRKLISTLTKDHLDVADEVGIFNEFMGARSVLKENFHEIYGEDGPIKTVMAVPMSINAEQIGVIVAINRTGKSKYFTTENMFLLESMSSQVALGITFVSMYDRLSKQQRIEQELELAQGIQQSLLPEDPPSQEHFLIHAECKAAREVSGDFYDFIHLSDDLLLVIIADASGKGMPACMLTAMCRSILRTNAERFRDDLEGLMREVNQKLFNDTDYAQFVTLACLLIDLTDHTVEYARAGHTPFLIRPASKNIEVISPDGPALGLLPPELSPQYDTFSFSWLPGTTLMLFTDGITEALSEDEEEYGIERLIESWNSYDTDPRAAIDGILEDVYKFAPGELQYDDQTLIILHRPQ